MPQILGRNSPAERALLLIAGKNGIIRTGEAMQDGIHPATLYRLRDSGVLERVSRGVYRVADMQPISSLDIVTVAARVPRAVICLVSALSFHDITTQVPHAVSIALERGAKPPRIEFPPVDVHYLSGESLTAGVGIHAMDGVNVRIYSPEKTLADCFKFRNRLGMDIVIEALKLYRERGIFDVGRLMKYARICRVEAVMKPYIEAML